MTSNAILYHTSYFYPVFIAFKSDLLSTQGIWLAWLSKLLLSESLREDPLYHSQIRSSTLQNAEIRLINWGK